jgi:hypothetical protein
MEDTTTTDTPVDSGAIINGIQVDDQGMAVAQPEDTEPVEAVTTSEEPTQEAPQEEEPEAEVSDNSTVEWLKKKGIDPSSPEAIEKVADMARNAEKAMHSKAQKASELEKAIDSGILQEAADTGFDSDDKLKLVRMETRMNVRDFFDGNPDAKQFETAMIQELTNKPHLAGDLESLYANAVVKSGKSLKSQGKREALESLAHTQTAAVPKGNAVTGAFSSSSTITPQNVDQMVSKMSVQEYQKRLPEINAAMAG